MKVHEAVRGTSKDAPTGGLRTPARSGFARQARIRPGR